MLAQLTSSINLDPASSQNNNQNVITFNIHFNQQLYQLRLPSEATVGKDFYWILLDLDLALPESTNQYISLLEQLKRKIFAETSVPVCRQAIRGWPPSKASDAQQLGTRLCNLDLSPENELILVDLTEDGFMDTEQ